MPYFPSSSAIVASPVPLSYRNILGRNGGFEVWQRGAGGSASFGIPAATQQYTADGWFFACGPNQVSHVIQTTGLTPGSRYAPYIARDPSQTGVQAMGFEFPLDIDEIAQIRGQIVTLSFSALAGANWSPAGGNLLAYLLTGTGPVARVLTTAYTGQVIVIGATVPLVVNTLTRYTNTSAAVVPTNTTQASVLYQWTPVGTAGANDAWMLDDVQLEVGNIATPFERRPFESELQACKRHYWKTFPYSVAPAQNAGYLEQAQSIWQLSGAGGGVEGIVRTPVTMRADPTVTTYNYGAANLQIRNWNTSVDCTATAVLGTSEAVRLFAVAAAGSAVNQRNAVHFTADAGI